MDLISKTIVAQPLGFGVATSLCASRSIGIVVVITIDIYQGEMRAVCKYQKTAFYTP